jgi:5-methylcytosine-specific restriction endonuclease McrA
MSLNAATIEILITKHGFTGQDLLDLAKAIESTKDATGAERQRRYRERKREGGIEGDWEALRATVFERDGYTCVYCDYQGDDLACDHRIPVLQGGKTALENLVTACRPCNASKGGRTPEEWLA